MSNKTSVSRYLIAGAAFVILVAGIRAAGPLVVPFLLAAFLAVILIPLVRKLQRCKLPLGVALLVVVLLAGLLGAGAIAMVAAPITDLSARMPEITEGLQYQAERFELWAEEKDIPLPDADTLQASGTTAVTRIVTVMVQTVGGLISSTVLILILMLFMLLEAAHVPAKLRAGLGEASPALDRVGAIVTTMRRYMLIKTATSFLTGVLITVLLRILGVDYAVVWGLVAFLLNFIPNIGSIIAAIPAVVVALVQAEGGMFAVGWPLALATGIVFLVVNMLIGYVIEPRFTSRGLGLSALVVLISLVFWGWVLGPVGMLLSAPLTMSIKITLEGFPETRWAAVLMGR